MKRLEEIVIKIGDYFLYTITALAVLAVLLFLASVQANAQTGRYHPCNTENCEARPRQSRGERLEAKRRRRLERTPFRVNPESKNVTDCVHVVGITGHGSRSQ